MNATRTLGIALLLIALPGCAFGAPRGDSLPAVDLSEIFARVQDSVVVIRTSETTVVEGVGGTMLASVGGIGSGVLIDGEGRILTAAHVVQVADEVEVEFPDGSVREARVIASEPAADIAMVQIVTGLPDSAAVAPIGDSDAVRVGEPVFVVGAPLGVSHTLTVGVLSARRRAPTMLRGETVELMQTDAAINQGNSGGPMFNSRGEVIGVVSHIISKTGGSEGLGFAVSSNLTKALLIDRPSFWSGIESVLLPPALGKALNVPPPSTGVLILRVARGSLAERVGLRGGTIPVRFGDQEIVLGGDVLLSVLGISSALPDASDRVREAYLALEPGQEFPIEILRDGVRVKLKGQRRADSAKTASGSPPRGEPR